MSLTDTGQEQPTEADILFLARLEYLRRQIEMYTVPSKITIDDDKAGYSLRQLNHWWRWLRVMP